MRQKLLVTALAGLLCTGQVLADGLSPAQKRNAQRLTDLSLRIFNVGEMVAGEVARSGSHYAKLPPAKFSCMKTQLSAQGFKRYQQERAERYVVEFSPEQIERDLAVFDNEVVDALHKATNMADKFVVKPNTDRQWEQSLERWSDAIAQTPGLESKMNTLVTDTRYAAVMDFVNLPQSKIKDGENAEEAGEIVAGHYLLWAMENCGVEISDFPDDSGSLKK